MSSKIITTTCFLFSACFSFAAAGSNLFSLDSLLSKEKNIPSLLTYVWEHKPTDSDIKLMRSSANLDPCIKEIYEGLVTYEIELIKTTNKDFVDNARNLLHLSQICSAISTRSSLILSSKINNFIASEYSRRILIGKLTNPEIEQLRKFLDTYRFNYDGLLFFINNYASKDSRNNFVISELKKSVQDREWSKVVVSLNNVGQGFSPAEKLKSNGDCYLDYDLVMQGMDDPLLMRETLLSNSRIVSAAFYYDFSLTGEGFKVNGYNELAKKIKTFSKLYNYSSLPQYDRQENLRFLISPSPLIDLTRNTDAFDLYWKRIIDK